MTTTEVAIVRATPRDTGRICNLVTEAWMSLRPVTHLIPDPVRRRTILPGLLRTAYIEPAMECGNVSVTASRMGTAAWVCVTPPGTDTSPVGVIEEQARRQRADREAIVRAVLLKELTGGLFPVVDRYLALREAARPMDRGPYSWLVALGVHPLFRGKGYGTALLSDFHQHLDREERGAYVEAVGFEAVEFFQRFGYQPIDDGGELREITFAPTVTAVPMFRDPVPVRADQSAEPRRIHRSAMGRRGI